MSSNVKIEYSIADRVIADMNFAFATGGPIRLFGQDKGIVLLSSTANDVTDVELLVSHLKNSGLKNYFAKSYLGNNLPNIGGKISETMFSYVMGQYFMTHYLLFVFPVRYYYFVFHPEIALIATTQSLLTEVYGRDTEGFREKLYSELIARTDSRDTEFLDKIQILNNNCKSIFL